jgi:hypothetical protein
MRARGRGVLAATAGLLLLVFLWSVFPGLARQATRSRRGQQPHLNPPAGAPLTYEQVVPMPTRDLFAFGPDHATVPAPSRSVGSRARTDAAPPPDLTPPPRARLVGFMQSEGRVVAALAIDSTVELVQAGGEIHGYRVLSLDADARTVRLRTPEGEDLELSAPTD